MSTAWDTCKIKHYSLLLIS